MEEVVVIIGAGPSGLATSVCLSKMSIKNIILEREDCSAPLWKKRAYDRLHLHVAKEFCEMPFLPHDPTSETYMPKDDFIRYLDTYISQFNITPRYNRVVESAILDESEGKWRIDARNIETGKVEVYVSRFLVVATGENSEALIPEVPGMESFRGEVLHSSEYKSGSKYVNKDVLVIGCGNSGMEISFDLSNYGARAWMVVRSPFHIVTRDMVRAAMTSLREGVPMAEVDKMLLEMSESEYGDLSGYGLTRPSTGPFSYKILAKKTPVIDVGTVARIRSGQIRVVPSIITVNGDTTEFSDGTIQKFDVVLFASGYKSVANKWLKDFRHILNENGLPREPIPNHWKGDHGIYCVGFGRIGIQEIARDARSVAEDINNQLADDDREIDGRAPVPPEVIEDVSSISLEE